MKGITFILFCPGLLLLSLAVGFTQNLVSNPGFESYSSCPTQLTDGISNEISKATSWNYLSPATGGTSDFYHSCAGPCPNIGASTPCNAMGYQVPRTGDGYGGFVTKFTWSPNYREYMQTRLISPLIGGVTYEVKMYVVSANAGGGGTFSDGMGAYFSTSMVTTGNSLVLAVTPQVMTNSIIADSVNWTEISGTFVAAGAEEYMVVGCFKNDGAIQSSGTNVVSYYYIDDICVTELGGNCGNLLPIKLLSFNAKMSNNKVTLNWQTETENNNDYFTIERSSNRQEFEDIGQVNGAGNSSSPITYSFTDQPVPIKDIVYYRLKQVDFDGKSTYSKTITVNISVADGVAEYMDLYGRKITHTKRLQSGVYIRKQGGRYKKIIISESR